MAFSFLFNAFLLEYMQSAKCPKPPIQLRKTLRGESEFHKSEIPAKKRCFRGPDTDCNNYNNLVSTNDGTYTPFNGHDKRINTDSSTNDQNFRVAHLRSGLDMRVESKQNSVQNHTKTQVDNPWITVVCQAICGEYEDSMLNDNSWAHGNNPSLNSSNMMTEQSHNIPHQQSFSTVNHVPSGQYIFDNSTPVLQEESGLPASLHKPNAQNSFDILYDTSTGSQNNVEQEDLDTMGAFQLNQLDTGTSCNHHSFTSGKLNISYDASDRHWDNSQNLNALSEFEAMVNTASQQLEPQNILINLETYCFLSFGVNKSTDTSFYRCLNDIKLYCSQKAASDDAKTNTATKPNLTGLFCTFSHGVDADNIATSAFIAIITNKTLFGDTTATIEQREYQYINYEKWVKDPKHGDSVYTYIEGLDVKEYNLKSMQDLYFLFIIYICMKYDDTLKCWVLRDYLWGTHVFMAEFYPCIIWKLEKLNLEIAKTFENVDEEDKYKNNIKDELKLLCIIISLYRGINAQTETHLYNKRLAMINLNIEKLREVIQKHLESFYYVDFRTLLFFLANKMNNHKICKSDIDEVGKLDKSDVEFLRFSDYIKSHDKLSDARRFKRIEGKKNNLEFYKDLHLNRMAKNALFIIAFTINTSSIKSSVYSMPYIKSTTIKKYKKTETEDNRTIVNKNNKKGVIRKEKIIERKQLKANKEKLRPVKKSENGTQQSKIGVKAANAKKRKKVEYLIDITPSNLFYQYIYTKDLYRDACDDALIGFLYIIKIVGMTEFYENNAQTAKHGDNILRYRLIMQKLHERNKKASSIRNFMFCDMIFKAIKEKVNANNYD